MVKILSEKMRLLVSLATVGACLILSNHAQAATAGIWCAVDAHFTRAAVTWDEHTVRMEVVNPTGFSFMPQFEAPVSQSTIPAIAAQSKELAGLGNEFIYQWDRKQCHFSADNGWLLECEGSVPAQGADNGIRAVLMTTAKIDESSLSSTQSTLRLRMVVEHGDLFFVAIPFPLTSCHLLTLGGRK